MYKVNRENTDANLFEAKNCFLNLHVDFGNHFFPLHFNLLLQRGLLFICLFLFALAMQN